MAEHWLLEKVGCPEGLAHKILAYAENTGNPVQTVVREGLALWAQAHKDDILAKGGDDAQ